MSQIFCANTSVKPGVGPPPQCSSIEQLTAALAAEGGADCVSSQMQLRELYSQDIWSAAAHVTAAVVTPTSTAQLARLVRIVTAHGFSISCRGGGMSYTAGYLPQDERTVTVDFSRMNRILAVRAQDMTVTVEAGCTWMSLYDALKPLGLRTPFWGPLSGLSSTIGGGVSQLNAIFGSGHHGTTSESVVGLTVVLADGRVLHTGAGGSTPFYRHYGPDLTGLFCGDCGSFGLKTEITLRLMRHPAHEAHASFAFASREQMVEATADLARSGLACEAFGFDPQLAQVRMRRASLSRDLQSLGAVVAAKKSKWRGAVDAAKIVLHGRDFLGDANYSVHAVCEGRTAAGVAADAAALRELLTGHGGVEIPDSIPRVLRAHPFTPLNSILGPDGERWVPVHGIVALSQANAACAAIEAMFAECSADCQALGVQHGFMYTTLSTNAFLIEPVFFWPDSHLAIHRATVEANLLARMPEPCANQAATELVRSLRLRVIQIFETFSAAHFQIGRTYAYRGSRDAASLELLDGIKRVLDPRRLVSPGTLEHPDGAPEPAPRTWTTRDPRTGERDQVFTAPQPKELQAMAQALRLNQIRWAAMGLAARIRTLQALAAGLATEHERAALRDALIKDTGRARIATTEIDAVMRSIHAWCAIASGVSDGEWSRGRSMPQLRHRARFVPYGLVTVVSPWNFPLLLAMIDALPALLAGCSVWIKPSEVTPRFIAPLQRLIGASPELAGVLQLVPGDGQTAAQMIDLGDCVCFTGSVATGKKVALRAAEKFIPAFLELGGKDPLIVLEGADLGAATDAALRGSVLATGQACQSIERIYVARAIHDEFVARLCDKARAVRFNYPDIGAGDIGPLIFEQQAAILAEQIADARDQGARVLTGGEIEKLGGGLWLAPTVITHVTHAMKVMREETFGPVMPVMAFDSIDEAVELANDSQFGLSAAVFGARSEECEAIAERLQAGAISINDAALTAQFQEAGKQSFRLSGLGPSRMGIDGYTRFMRRQALIVNESAPLPLAAFREEGPQ